MSVPIKIGTRASQLALWQAEWVASEIEKRHVGTEVELVKIKTTGDKITDVPLAQVGGKGLFVKEIEEALLSGEVDLAVHSMKDVPTYFPDGLELRAITDREDARDALLSRDNVKLLDLPDGARIGTSSLRRQSQLLCLKPELEILPLRGNLDTRIRKLEEGEYDAIILAAAGINRLGWAGKITEYISPAIMLPAIGQGALGIETRIGDERIIDVVDSFNDESTSYAVRAERALLKRLEGGCQVPIAAYGTVYKNTVSLTGLVASTDGNTVIKDIIEGNVSRAEELGVMLAESLLEAGGTEILKEFYGTEVE
ncbi:Porphobilinogen deaminase [hydrothermal vent metagenome]|uniref:Porphobilinogen deaminase n=1 Tax=hydrothermal vent metagenome TaxID=652676 RepID=A0A3B0R0R7_9ZZZZ